MSSNSLDDDGTATTSFPTVLPSDIMRSHILPLLDGPTLLSATCASSDLHKLSSDDTNLWKRACHATWPSTADPRVRHVVDGFPNSHRSLFSDSFPDLVTDRLESQRPLNNKVSRITESSVLISAVDVFYKDSLVFSKVHVSDTQTSWFACSPFHVDLVGHGEHVPVPIRHGGLGDTWLHDLEDNLTVSWVVIDPTPKRSGSVSGRRPVSVKRHWLSGDVQARFGSVFGGSVTCGVVVTCGGKEGGEVHVTEMSMQLEDLDGKTLSGRDSLVILQAALGGARKKRDQGQNGKISFEEFEESKTRRRNRMQKIERTLDLVCIATGVTAFITFWSYLLVG